MRDYSKLSISERECHSWSEFEGETIFLTGGSGFFGTALLYSLLNAKKKVDLNINVTVLSRNINLFKQKHPKLADSYFIKLLEDIHKAKKDLDFQPSIKFQDVLKQIKKF